MSMLIYYKKNSTIASVCVNIKIRITGCTNCCRRAYSAIRWTSLKLYWRKKPVQTLLWEKNPESQLSLQVIPYKLGVAEGQQ